LINNYDNLVILRTFSKVYGLGGLRLGYAVSNEGIIKNLLKTASPYSVNTAAIVAANAAIINTNLRLDLSASVNPSWNYTLNSTGIITAVRTGGPRIRTLSIDATGNDTIGCTGTCFN